MPISRQLKSKTDNLPDTPAAVGSAMTLTPDYDKAKTAAQEGDEMGLTTDALSAITDKINEVVPNVNVIKFAGVTAPEILSGIRGCYVLYFLFKLLVNKLLGQILLE